MAGVPRSGLDRPLSDRDDPVACQLLTSFPVVRILADLDVIPQPVKLGTGAMTGGVAGAGLAVSGGTMQNLPSSDRTPTVQLVVVTTLSLTASERQAVPSALNVAPAGQVSAA